MITFIAGLIGLVASFDLTIERIEILKNIDYVPSCNFSILFSCKGVMMSAEAEAFGFPNPIIGVAGFAVMVVLGLAAWANVQFPRWFWVGSLLGTSLAVVFVHWLIYSTLANIGVLCPWCMVVWTITIPLWWYQLIYVGSLYRGTTGWVRVLANWHLVPVVLWYVTVAALIFIAFWDSYWKLFFQTL